MSSNFFKKIFSLPNYISMQSAGIEVGNRSIRYLEFSNTKGIVKLLNFGEIPLPTNVFKDGQIINKDELKKALDVVKGYLKSPFVKVSVPEEKTYLFNIKLPYLNPNEIRPALEFKLEESVPLKATESIFEFKLIRKPKRKTEDLFLNVSVIPKSTIDDYVEVFSKAGLNVISFETESKMVSKALIPRNDHKTYMIVHIKDDSTTMSIISQGVTCFTSSVPVGNNSVLESLKKVSSENFGKISKIPNKILSLDDYYDEDVYGSLLNIFSVIKDEIEKFNKYWNSQVESHSIDGFNDLDKIVLCGKASAIPGLVNHINQNVGVETTVGNIWQNVFSINDSVPELNFFDSLDYAVSAGLSIPSKNSMQ